MCGLAGYFDLRDERPVDEQVLAAMTERLTHRGPDSSGYFIDGGFGLGFRRLSIIDLRSGDQPIFNEDKSKMVACNGEIFNYTELRAGLTRDGHTFRTKSDVEVLVHLYEDRGVDFLNEINGQFAFAIFDRKTRTVLLARDQFGINPLYYAIVDGVFIFASEVKAMLEHPLIERRADPAGLDQVFSFPGLVSPRSMFEGVSSLKSGHYILIKNQQVRVNEYWDLDYPKESEISYARTEDDYVAELRELLARSVRYRLQADVPVGFYLSGGLDSSMIAALIDIASPGTRRHSFSIGFTEREISETSFQKTVAGYVGSAHHEILFDWGEIAGRLERMIYHCETPVKETYNTCSLALSEAARSEGIPVVLTGEGADELFAGYVGYRFDRFRAQENARYDLEAMMEEELRERMWGDRSFFYEKNHYALKEMKSALYSQSLNEACEDFESANLEVVNKERLHGRHFIHRRSYLDFKLRLSDHLIADHGDRMALANSVEARYPFLDIDLIEFSKIIPPDLKLNQYSEKYILKKAAEGLIPSQIIKREKFGFHAPGSPFLLQRRIEWIDDMLSYERIKREGYFNPDTVEALKTQYSAPGFKLNLPFEDDLLVIVLTFGIFKEVFRLPDLG